MLMVTEDGYEICVCCKAKTEVKAETPIDARKYYTYGIGQLCKLCAVEMGA